MTTTNIDGVQVVSASIPKQPLIAWLRKVLENTANRREERDAAGVLLRGLDAAGVASPSPDPNPDAQAFFLRRPALDTKAARRTFDLAYRMGWDDRNAAGVSGTYAALMAERARLIAGGVPESELAMPDAPSGVDPSEQPRPKLSDLRGLLRPDQVLPSGPEPSGETMQQREEVCAAWHALPDDLRKDPRLSRLYRALGGPNMESPPDGVKGTDHG